MPRKQTMQIFKNLVIAFSGNFNNSGHENRCHINLTNWVKRHGGDTVAEVTQGTTHLICTVEDFKKKTSQVRKAKALGRNQCKIVTYDWLEDCLIPIKSKSPPKLRKTEDFELQNLEKTLKRIKKKQVEHTQNYGDQLEASNHLADRNLFHIYQDDTGFQYKVSLTRLTSPSFTACGKNLGLQRWTLYLFESNAIPRLHMVGGRYKKGSQKPAWLREYCSEMLFSDALKLFKMLFKDKTGIEWDNRLDGIRILPEEERYVYTPPDHGKPRGLVPIDWVDILAPKPRIPFARDSDTEPEIVTEFSQEASTYSSSPSTSEISGNSDGSGSSGSAESADSADSADAQEKS